MRKKTKQHNTRKDLEYKKQDKERKAKKSRKKEKEIIQYNGIPCDSYPEKYTLMWLSELEAAELVVRDSIKRSQSYLLFNTVSRNWVERLKTKSNPRVETLLAAHLYTPDFVFELTEKGRKCGLFSDIDGDCRLRVRNSFNLIHQGGIVHIETKGKSFRTSDDTMEKFSVDRKWVWEKHGVYVNLFICDHVFPKTWTPSAYRVTDKTLKPRKINWELRNLSSYLKMIK